jgi:hypothetical protein
MSMYTHLLDAAVGQRAWVPVRPTERSALTAVRRCRAELERKTPQATDPDPDTVPVVLARELGYDVALLELAEVVGIETAPSRFEQPRRERARLEQAFLKRGFVLQEAAQTAHATLGRV